MPAALRAESSISHLESLLAKHSGLAHLRVRARGSLLLVESGDSNDRIPHARFRRDTVHLWILEFPDHRGRWQRTPYRAQLHELFDLVCTTFPWTLAPLT